MSLFTLVIAQEKDGLNWKDVANKIGGKIIDHDAKHTGIDLFSQPGKKFFAPITCKVIRIEKDTVSDWTGLIIEGYENYKNLKLRILGVKPSVKVGQEVKRGELLGITQDPRIEYSDIRPYIHFELYDNNKLVNPIDLAKKIFQDRPIINAGSDSNFMFPRHKFFDEAQLLGSRGDFRGAIVKYKQSLKYPYWEITNNNVYHYLADNYAKLGEFSNAVQAQSKLVEILKMELEFASRNIPDKKLGVIAAVNSVDSLMILINAHEANLSSYESHGQTVIYY